MITIDKVNDLREFKGLNFEKLTGSLKGSYSIRLNKQYRLLFTIEDEQKDEVTITEISKHYE